MIKLRNLILAFILSSFSYAGVYAQEEKADSVISLASELMNVWNRKTFEGDMQLRCHISQADTTFALAFELRAMSGFQSIGKGERLNVRFDDGTDMDLFCRKDVNMGDGEIRGYGLMPGRIKYNTLKPRYDVSKEQLVRIVEGNVKTLTFYMQGEPFEISVLGNRFSLVTGEECAGLKPTVKGDNVIDTKIKGKDLFGGVKLRRNVFGWNNTYSLGIGMSHIYSSLGSKSYSKYVPKNLFVIDGTLKGLYFGVGFGRKEYNESIIEDCNVLVGELRVGPSFRYGNFNSVLTVAPYIGVIYCDQKNESRKLKDENSEFLIGCRISYLIKKFQIGMSISSHDIGATIGYGI